MLDEANCVATQLHSEREGAVLGDGGSEVENSPRIREVFRVKDWIETTPVRLRGAQPEHNSPSLLDEIVDDLQSPGGKRGFFGDPLQEVELETGSVTVRSDEERNERPFLRLHARSITALEAVRPPDGRSVT